MPSLTRRVRWLAIGGAVVVSGVVGGLSAGLADRRPSDVPRSPATAQVDELRIAFVERLGSNAAADRLLPALHGVELALEAAETAGQLPVDVELVRVEPWERPEELRGVLADPRYVAAIGAPYLTGQLALGDELAAAGLPFVTLSANGPGLSANGWRTWFRAVASVDAEAAAVDRWLDANGVGPEEVCLAGDRSAATAPFLHAIAERLEGRAAARTRLGPDVGTAELVARIGRAACDVVVWGGDGMAGGTVAAALAAHASRPTFVGGSNLRDPAFAEAGGRASRGAISASSCADVSTETRLAAQRFVQDYQSQFARPPGTFAVEAWDVTRWIVQGIGAGGVTRESLVAELRALLPFDGLARTYAFDAGGEPAARSVAVTLSRFQAGRWVAQSVPQPAP